MPAARHRYLCVNTGFGKPANQEDVSMATFAARRLQPMLRTTGHIVAIELLAGEAQIAELSALRLA